jgi:putative transposase
MVLSLYAKGLTTGEISAHFAEIYGASVSKETISRITDKVLEEMADWCSRPLDGVYAAVFIDAVMVKVRDGQVANRPIYAAIGVSLAGERDILGLWAGSGGEGAKFWMSVLTDLKNRGINDVFFVVCDGLKGLPEVVGNAWPQAIVQTCIVHLIRNTFRLTSRRDWDALKRDLRPIYTAVNATAARAALEELGERWGQRYPAIIRLRQNAWEEFIPFLDYDVEIRQVICSTNAIVISSFPVDHGCDLGRCVVGTVLHAAARGRRRGFEHGRIVTGAGWVRAGRPRPGWVAGPGGRRGRRRVAVAAAGSRWRVPGSAPELLPAGIAGRHP